MASSTPNLNLRKPDGVDLVNVLSDLDANYDVLDTEVGKAGAWTAYAPVWATSGVAPVIGNGSLSGRSKKMGKTLLFTINLVAGTTTTYGTGTWTFSLPAGILTGPLTQEVPVYFGLAALYHGLLVFAGGANVGTPLVDVGSAGGVLGLPTSTLPGAWASGNSMNISGALEVA